MNEALRARVLELMHRHGIGYFDYEGPDGVLTLDADQLEQEHPPILARTAGIFLWRHPADQSVAVWPRRVRRSEVVGWLKIGPLLEPIRAVLRLREAERAQQRETSYPEGLRKIQIKCSLHPCQRRFPGSIILAPPRPFGSVCPPPPA